MENKHLHASHDRSILIHHHASAFVDSQGIWIHSTMGRWITEIARQVQKVGLLTHVTDVRMSFQDTCIENKNVILHSMGRPGRTWDKIERTIRIRKACREVSGKYPVLLIRGITPRQHIVWSNVKAKHKYFLLVCEPVNKYHFNNLNNLVDVYCMFMERYRVLELRRILSNSNLLVNWLGTIDRLKSQYGWDARFVPTNTIMLKEFTEPKVRPLGRHIKLMFCGRIDQTKGVIELVLALDMALKRGYNIEASLIGPFADKAYYELVKRTIEELRIQDYIKFLGPLTFDKLFAYYRSSDLFVGPSYREGFPHVLWEAAASCLPIITTPVGGIPFLFKHREHAIFVKPKQVEELALAIISILEDNELRSKIINNAYALAREYCVEKCAEKLVDLIEFE